MIYLYNIYFILITSSSATASKRVEVVLLFSVDFDLLRRIKCDFS